MKHDVARARPNPEKRVRYWDQRVCLGGEDMSRGKAYQTLRRIALKKGRTADQATNDALAWLNGYDLGLGLKPQRPNPPRRFRDGAIVRMEASDSCSGIMAGSVGVVMKPPGLRGEFFDPLGVQVYAHWYGGRAESVPVWKVKKIGTVEVKKSKPAPYTTAARERADHAKKVIAAFDRWVTSALQKTEEREMRGNPPAFPSIGGHWLKVNERQYERRVDRVRSLDAVEFRVARTRSGEETYAHGRYGAFAAFIKSGKRTTYYVSTLDGSRSTDRAKPHQMNPSRARHRIWGVYAWGQRIDTVKAPASWPREKVRSELIRRKKFARFIEIRTTRSK